MRKRHKLNQGQIRENEFASSLKRKGVEYKQHPRWFPVGGRKYFADFYLPEKNKYVEVIGSRQAFHCRKEKIQEAMNYVDIELVHPNGTPFKHNLVKPLKLLPLVESRCRCGKEFIPRKTNSFGLCVPCRRREETKRKRQERRLKFPRVEGRLGGTRSKELEDLRNCLNNLWIKYDCPVRLLRQDLVLNGVDISQAHLYKFLTNAGNISKSKEMRIRRFLTRLKQTPPQLVEEKAQ